LEEQMQKSISDSLGLSKPVTVDAWVDGDYHPRKLEVTLPFLGQMTLTMHLSDFGQAVQVDAPSGAKQLDLSNLISGKLGQALGGDFGNSFGSGSSSNDFSDQLSKQLQDELKKALSGQSGSGGSANSSDFSSLVRSGNA